MQLLRSNTRYVAKEGTISGATQLNGMRACVAILQGFFAGLRSQCNHLSFLKLRR